MFKSRYRNFVKASSHAVNESKQPTLSGDEAKEIYLTVIQNAGNSTGSTRKSIPEQSITHKKLIIEDISNKDLFLCVQNNDVKMLRNIFDSCPRLVNTVDEYGWSLLMIACQANSVDAVKELLTRGVDTSVRDKGGNSATNLVINNKNLEIANLLIDHRKINHSVNVAPSRRHVTTKETVKVTYNCEICNNVFPDKSEHLASTVHNIDASKDKKLPTHYAIPQSNRGYQIMLKVGWDRERGLGRDGSGKKYPIKAVQKKDRKGLGLDKKKIKEQSKEAEHRNSKIKVSRSRSDKKMEINFRREFY